MVKHRIRITGAGIHGMPTDDNPSGEYAIGTEFETDADLPEGWKGRAEIVGGSAPKDGSKFVVGERGAEDSAKLPALTGKNKAELLSIAKAEGVEVEEGASNDDIRSAIELHRETNRG